MTVVAAISALVLYSLPVYAHPGRTDSAGCHTCRTNCSSWGLSYGEYHCHQSKGIPQPEYPIHSRLGSPGYTEPAPEYTTPKSITPQTREPTTASSNNSNSSGGGVAEPLLVTAGLGGVGWLLYRMFMK